MSTLVLEHVKASELPGEWARRLKAMPTDTFRVVIATEVDPGVSLQDVAGRASDETAMDDLTPEKLQDLLDDGE